MKNPQNLSTVFWTASQKLIDPNPNDDVRWMRRALELASRGIGWTSPNPRVGAVVVKNGRLVGEGYHRRVGSSHAEVIALKKAGKKARSATLYVNLEPCAHYGRTPPCVQAVLKSGVQRVVIAQKDPNPIANGRGIHILKKHQLKVETGLLSREAEALNRPFIKWVRQKLPYVTLKVAQSLDGKIATSRGESRWISSSPSRRWRDRLRASADAVLVGIRTVLKDDPSLSSVLPSKEITKIVLDSRLRIPRNARLFKTPGRVILATTSRSNPRRRKRFVSQADLILCPLRKRGIDLRFLLRKLAQEGILHILVEGGGEVIASFIEEGLADEIFLLIAPMIIGGRSAPTSVQGQGISNLKKAWRLKGMEISPCGPDLLVHGFFTPNRSAD